MPELYADALAILQSCMVNDDFCQRTGDAEATADGRVDLAKLTAALRVPPVDEIAEIAASMGETKRLVGVNRPDKFHQFAVASTDYSRPYLLGCYQTLEAALKAQGGKPEKWDIFVRLATTPSTAPVVRGLTLVGWLFRVKGEANPWNFSLNKFNNEAYEFEQVYFLTEQSQPPTPVVSGDRD